MEPIKYFLAYSADRRIRHAASSGGFVKSFLHFLLESKTVDQCIVTSLDVNTTIGKTILTNNIDIITSPTTNSVYQVIDYTDSLKKSENFTNVAGVCLPCAVDDFKAHNICPVISLVCHHTPTYQCTLDNIHQFGLIAEDVEWMQYRGNGWPGQFIVVDKRGKIHSKKSALAFPANTKKYMPDRCQRCKDVGYNADILVGDPWVIKNKDDIGKTVVMVYHQGCQELIRQATLLNYIQTEEFSREEMLACLKYYNKLRENRC